MKASGMCGSDLKFYRSAPGRRKPLWVLEICKNLYRRPRALRRGRRAWPGRLREGGADRARVMDHHYAGCGVCKHCRVGWSQLCRAGSPCMALPRTAAMRNTSRFRRARWCRCPMSSFIAGAAVSCGTGTAYGALRRMHLAAAPRSRCSDRGPSASAPRSLAQRWARVIAVEKNAERRELAKQFGADVALESEEQIKDLTKGEGVDLALDTTGVPAARLAAIRSAKTWGTVCFVGEGGDVTIDVSRDMLRKQLTLIGSWTFSAMGQLECALRRRQQDRPRRHLLAPLEARAGGRGLPRVRHAVDRQGRDYFLR